MTSQWGCERGKFVLWGTLDFEKELLLKVTSCSAPTYIVTYFSDRTIFCTCLAPIFAFFSLTFLEPYFGTILHTFFVWQGCVSSNSKCIEGGEVGGGVHLLHVSTPPLHPELRNIWTAPTVHRVLASERLPMVGCQISTFISSFWTITTKTSRLKALLLLLEICLVPIQLVHPQIIFL